MIKIISPLFVYTSNSFSARKYVLNLNIYRNQHFRLEHKVKKCYTEIMMEQLMHLKLETPIKLHYRLFKGRKGGDRNNPLSIHDKYFCDALTHYGCIPDDNDDYIESQFFETAGVDRKNPRVEILITSCKKI